MKYLESILERRSFFTGMGAAGAAALAGTRAWRPGHESKDDWLDRIPGRHRMVFDSTMPNGFGAALVFANNFYIGNTDGYGLRDSDVAVVIVARHYSTPFSLVDAMWAKYGATISRLGNVTDPKTNQVPSNNIYMASLGPLLKRGMHLAVCGMATRELANSIASDVGGDSEKIYKELTANLVTNSHIVATGIVAVNRAQERGYAFVST